MVLPNLSELIAGCLPRHGGPTMSSTHTGKSAKVHEQSASEMLPALNLLAEALGWKASGGAAASGPWPPAHQGTAETTRSSNLAVTLA